VSAPGTRTRQRAGFGLAESLARWITRRHPNDGLRTEITRDRVYILPTRYGYLLLAMLAVMLLGSINYSNNMAFLLTFLVAGIGHNAMWYTHRNLLGLGVTVLPVEPVFAGQAPLLRLRIKESGGRAREALRTQAGSREGRLVHLAPQGTQDVEIPLEPLSRGIYGLPRQRLSTRYPLGLLESWTWLSLATEVVVYPRPLPAGTLLQIAADDSAGEGSLSANTPAGVPDEIREYRPGDPPGRIAWKAVARTGRLFVRDPSASDAHTAWLCWDDVAHADAELRLSVLCQLVLDANATGESYGLALPTVRIEPSTGPEHLTRCLRALAAFGGRGGSS